MEKNIICPLLDEEIQDIDCVENIDCVEGIQKVSSLPEKYKKKEKWKDICKQCKYHNI